ncbi:MAG: hypothetical protein HY691_20640 [Chloroflexi bacterium]|nr:hypothetical protein [Chloroflexota bacterium]
MSDSLHVQIRVELARYLDGEISLEQFEDWFLPATWNVHLAGEDEAANLAYDIDAVLAQASSERWPETRIKAALGRVLSTVRLRIGDPPRECTSALNTIVECPFAMTSFEYSVLPAPRREDEGASARLEFALAMAPAP